MTGESMQVTPDCTAPLQDTTYLKSPLECIVNSLEPNSVHSNHDLLDAYSTFSNRIRAEAQELQRSSTSLSALELLRIKAHAFSQALRRDITLAHIDPFAATRTFASGESLLSGPRQSTADVVKHAGDSSALCQQALCALAAVFRFPNLHSLFSDPDISSLLAEILTITHSPQLPSLNSAKTVSLAFWILHSQRLPQGSLSPRASDIVSALRRTLHTQPIGQQSVQLAGDGLKGICHLLEFYPTTFLVPIIQLLPSVLSHLLCDYPAVRLQAALALGRIALNFLDSSLFISPDHRQATSDFVLDFLDTQCARTTSPQIPALQRIAQAAMSMKEEPEPVEGPVWLLSIITSLVILSDHCLFSHSCAFKFIMRFGGLALTHQRSVVRALVPHIWTCIIFVFARIPDEDVRTKEAVFLFLGLDPGGGIGATLVTTLLNTSAAHSSSSSEQTTSFDAVSRALTLVHDMAHNSNKHTSSDSLSLLHKLMGGVGASAPMSSPDLTASPLRLPTPLFDGSIITASWDRLKTILRSIYRPPVNEVRHLSEAEIIQHRTLLRSTWVQLARARISYESCLPPDLIHIWQSLLLVESQLTQGFYHLTTSADVVEESALIVTGFIPRTPEHSEESDPMLLVAAQARALAAITQLWSMMKNVFASQCISTTAKIILTDFDESVRDQWSRLCADLMATAIPSCIQGLHHLASSQMAERISRELCPETFRWLDIVKFLVVPLGSWTMSDVESDVWNSLLQKALTSAGQASTASSTVIDAIAQAVLPVTSVDRMILLQTPLSHLLSPFIPDASSCPPDSLLSVVNSVLQGAYETGAEIQQIIMVSSPSHVLHILESLQTGLQIWIEDKGEVLTKDDFNSVIMPLYSDTLVVLERHPLSLGFLHSVEYFLAAGFSRIIPPAVAPFAFERFWKATYHGKHQFSSDIPAGVTSLLKAFTSVFGGDLLAGIPSDSQSTTSSDMPSSPIREHSHINPAAEHCSSAVLDDAPYVEHTFGDTTPRNRPISPSHIASLGDAASSQDLVVQDSQDDLNGPDEILTSCLPDPRQGGVIPSNEQSSSSGSSRVTRSMHRAGQGSKRRRQSQDSPPQKRRRTITGMHKCCPSRFISEPTSKAMPPVRVTRPYSAPAEQSKRMVFDGIVLPTLRQVIAAERNRSFEPLTGSSPETFQFNDPPRSVQTLSVASDDDYDSWEIRCPEMSTSDMDVDDSVAEVPESPQQESSSILQEAPTRMYQRSKSQANQYVTQHPAPLRRSNTGSSHVDALRDVYAAVASGSSQMPVQELVQATKLVYQIGTVLK
ncbi:hypothetical protein DFH29DRAFT_912381 [Suillus ampliporus]|nr:hypothetical protein DFH29DRAFT_912381 [Suillus ampliporus]